MSKWIFNEDADGDHAIFSETGKLIAVTVGWENSAASWSKEEDAANARLLAAAPQVLEALKALYEETAEYILVNNLGDVHHNRSMQMARDAIRLAVTCEQCGGEGRIRFSRAEHAPDCDGSCRHCPVEVEDWDYCECQTLPPATK